MVDLADDMPDGSRGYGPLQAVRSDELHMLLGDAFQAPSRESVAAFEGATDELAGGYFLREKREGAWVVVGTAVTIKEARDWATAPR